MSKSALVLVVEDDPNTATEMLANLKSLGYRPQHASPSADAQASIWVEAPASASIDRPPLPGPDGLSLISKMRDEGIHLPVLVLRAPASVDESIHNHKAGGGDHLGKPVVADEMFARIETLLRRPEEARETTLRAGPLTLDLIDRSASRDRRKIDLLPREFKLLEFMMRRSGQVLSRAMLLEGVWHYRFVPESNLVAVHMSRLRQKIDLPGEIKLIRSVKNVGFMLDTSI